jgi:hypothetical protein
MARQKLGTGSVCLLPFAFARLLATTFFSKYPSLSDSLLFFLRSDPYEQHTLKDLRITVLRSLSAIAPTELRKKKKLLVFCFSFLLDVTNIYTERYETLLSSPSLQNLPES